MNFEFLQNLKGLKCIYKYCKNAEDLALSKPDCSMFSSRKSGEALARFIYLSSYKETAENLTFSDILTDYTVKNYIGKREVLDALHNIRKNGNSAVHEDNDNTSEQAIELLEDLHYAAGEIARKEHLIDSYPRFDTSLEEHQDTILQEFDPIKVAEEMFSENVARYRAEKLFEEYKTFSSPLQIVHGNSDINEFVEFRSKPSTAVVYKLQNYFGYLAMKAIKYQYEEGPERELKYEAKILIYGEESRETTNIFDFMESLMEDLPKAKHFSISSSYYGTHFAGQVDDELDVPLDRMIEFDKCENAGDITYKSFEFLYNHGEGGCNKFENGKWLHIADLYSQDILDKDFGEDWWCWNMSLMVEFDTEKHPHILETLQNTVRKHIPEDQIEYCENAWADGDTHILVQSISWFPRKLRVVQNFLDEVNEILAPIKNECECYCIGDWHITTGPKATATWDWFEDGFKVVGTEL